MLITKTAPSQRFRRVGYFLSAGLPGSWSMPVAGPGNLDPLQRAPTLKASADEAYKRGDFRRATKLSVL